MCAAVIPVGREDQFFSIGTEHREGIEQALAGNLLKPAAVFIDHKQLKIVSFFAVVIA